MVNQGRNKGAEKITGNSTLYSFDDRFQVPAVDDGPLRNGGNGKMAYRYVDGRHLGNTRPGRDCAQPARDWLVTVKTSNKLNQKKQQ